MNIFKKKSYKYKNQKLINEWNDTKNYFKKNSRPITFSSKINWETIEKELPIINANKNQNAIIEVVNEDTYNMAIKYVDEGLSPLVLNMASDYKPGGGVESGKLAQEEELFRRSNAHLTHQKEWYPLQSDELIYSPEITIIKDTSEYNYKLIDEKVVSMVSCAAIRNPKLINKVYIDKDYNTMYNKIEAIFKVGIMMYHDSLVLGALGCGAFNNPPNQVAEIFGEMIMKYHTNFKKIGFAVLVVKSKDNENFACFSNAIEKINKIIKLDNTNIN